MTVLGRLMTERTRTPWHFACDTNSRRSMSGGGLGDGGREGREESFTCNLLPSPSLPPLLHSPFLVVVDVVVVDVVVLMVLVVVAEGTSVVVLPSLLMDRVIWIPAPVVGI